jgi:hypothetical protein
MMAQATFTMSFDVIQPAGSIVPNVFVVNVELFASGTAWVAGDGTHNSLVANLTLVNVSMTLASSTIGPIKLELLQDALNLLTVVLSPPPPPLPFMLPIHLTF